MKTDRKELVEWVRGIYQNLDDADKRDALRFFPELAESEDERIRRFIQDRLTDRLWNPTWKFSRDDVLAYLERQKENTLRVKEPVEQKERKRDYYSGMSELEQAIHCGFLCAGVENASRTIIEETAQECMSKINSAGWSEEDKANLDNIIWLCENCEKGIENVWIPSQATQIKHLIKSLRPQWKPSKKQMDGLKHFVDWHRQQYLTASTPWPAYEALQSLQTDLLKLKQS